jgi:hypothetical protein
VISTNVQLAPGAARTVAGVGKYSSLGLAILTDDLSAPPTGQTRVRIIQASARVPSMDVKAAGGPTIASAAAFATTTKYATVPAGNWSLEVGPSGGAATTKSDVQLAAGGVYSVVVLDAKGSGLQVLSRVDATGAPVMPAGAVDTGLGGTQRDGVRSGAWATLALPIGLGLLLVALGTGLAWRRRGPRQAALR